jgi:hypothetical protein
MQRLSNSIAGLALLSVLIFLELFAILTLALVRTNLWEIKISNQQAIKAQLVNTALLLLPTVEAKADAAIIHCQLPVTPPANLILQPTEWWQSTACSGNFGRWVYYYTVEFLQTDECTIPEPSNYYRISLLLIEPVANSARVIIQSIFVVPQSSPLICHSSTHNVQQGRQSWQELT